MPCDEDIEVHRIGEEKYSNRIADAIIKNRPINTTLELVDVIKGAVPESYKRDHHPARKVFQAIRIEVNNELQNVFEKLGFEVIGGVDAPFMWLNVKRDSWKFFDFCLKKLNVVVIPGVIFGSNGEGYVRVSALGNIENSKEAIRRFKEYYEK